MLVTPVLVGRNRQCEVGDRRIRRRLDRVEGRLERLRRVSIDLDKRQHGEGLPVVRGTRQVVTQGPLGEVRAALLKQDGRVLQVAADATGPRLGHRRFK
jgi:hypothetical protein